MATRARDLAEHDLVKTLVQSNYLFKGLDEAWVTSYLHPHSVKGAKLYASQPIYTAFRVGEPLDVLYAITTGGPVIIRSTPLDRVIGISYAGSCFGMRSLPCSYGLVSHGFPSLVEAYKTADVIKIPLEAVEGFYQDEVFRKRYDLLFELREKFQYHLLNCSTYPPQAVAALLRSLIYQERELGNQPESDGTYAFDLPIDIIARASQLNHRTVEQVLKGMRQAGLLAKSKQSDTSSDIVRVLDPEGLKETYSATRDKVHWWPLREK